EYFNFALTTISTKFRRSFSEAEKILAEHDIVRDPRSDRVGSVTKVMRSLGMSREEWNTYRDEHFDISSLVRTDTRMGEALQGLAQGSSLVLLSNNTGASVTRILGKLGVPENVFAVQVTSEVDLPPKPDPTVYENIAGRLSVSFEQMISVGDRYTV